MELGAYEMKLLLKREQTDGAVGRVNFKLWAKIEIDEDERAMLKRYRLDQALLMGVNDPNLLRRAATYGFGVFILSLFLLEMMGPFFLTVLSGDFDRFEATYNFHDRRISVLSGFWPAFLIGSGFAYWYFNEKRDQIFVRDLLHGRHFSCKSIIDLTRKEAEISEITAIFRQVMESAKHWGGTQAEDIPVLSRDEARELILKVF